MSDPGVITVTIFGREYTLRTTDDPAYLAELARCVDRHMHDAAAGGPDSSALRAAVLAALNLADELTREKQAREADQLALDGRTGRIAAMLAEEVGKRHAGGV